VAVVVRRRDGCPEPLDELVRRDERALHASSRLRSDRCDARDAPAQAAHRPILAPHLAKLIGQLIRRRACLDRLVEVLRQAGERSGVVREVACRRRAEIVREVIRLVGELVRVHRELYAPGLVRLRLHDDRTLAPLGFCDVVRGRQPHEARRCQNPELHSRTFVFVFCVCWDRYRSTNSDGGTTQAIHESIGNYGLRQHAAIA
jgi:hypothetical protein